MAKAKKVARKLSSGRPVKSDSVISATNVVKKPVSTAVRVIAWLTGVLVSLAVGFGMIITDPILERPVLTIPYIPTIVTIIAGWIVVLGVVISILSALLKR